jgi:hypothetical protein
VLTRAWRSNPSEFKISPFSFDANLTSSAKFQMLF